jgi:outer membrane protein
LGVLVAFCLLPSAYCPLAFAQELKIGYVNLAKVFDGYERTKASEATLEKQGKAKEAELEGRMTELKKLRQNLELLNNEAREAKSREIEEKSEELQRFRNAAARDLGRDRDRVARDLLKAIQDGIDSYAKANGFTLVLDSRSLLYAMPAQDVTDGVLKLLNGQAAAKPATPQ